MKKNLVSTVFFVLILMWVPTGLIGQSMVASVGVDKDDIDLRGSVQILDSLTINVSTAGQALLRFDGYCVASPGDKIFLAISRTRIWGACDNNINIEVPDDDVNMAPFTHTRLFDLMPGTHTFYAVAHNHIEQQGSGRASIHGNVLLEFFEPDDAVEIKYVEIAQENRLVRGTPFIFGLTTLSIPETGKVLVNFDGLCISTPGDMIALAASATPGIAAQSGAVLVEAYSGDLNAHSFSHSRTYEVGPGSQTFYAVAQNIQEMDGNGRISVFGTLTAVYYPDKIKTDLLSHEIAISAMDVRSANQVLDQITINSEYGGTIVTQLNGMTGIQQGDRISFAISDDVSFPVGNSHMILESLENGKPYRSFSLTSVMDIGPGEHTFYINARNSEETDGSGMISAYGNFTVIYEGNEVISGSLEGSAEMQFFAYPNPATHFIYLNWTGDPNMSYTVELIDAAGRVLEETIPDISFPYRLYVAGYPAGLYFVRLKGQDHHVVKSVIIQ